MADTRRPRDAFGELFAADKYVNAGIESRGQGAPEYSGAVGVGPFSVEGRYQRPVPEAPADWRAMLQYKRRF